MQVARALIHDPAMINKIKINLMNLDEKRNLLGESNTIKHDIRHGRHTDIEDAYTLLAISTKDTVSACTHCNLCVVATLDPTKKSGCVLI